MAQIFSEEPLAESIIADWKEKYRGVFEMDVPATDEDDDLLIEGTIELRAANAIFIPEVSTGDETQAANAKLALESKQEAIEKAQSKIDSVKKVKGFFRKVDIDELALLENHKGSKLKGSLIVYNTSLLGGHPAFRDDEDVKIVALKQLQTVLKQRSASIKKL